MKFVIREGKRYWYRDECVLICKITMPGEGKIVESCDRFKITTGKCTKLDKEEDIDK